MGTNKYAIEMKPIGGGPRHGQMSVVYGVERAPEDRDASLNHVRSIFTELIRTSLTGRSCAPRGTSEIFFTTS